MYNGLDQEDLKIDILVTNLVRALIDIISLVHVYGYIMKGTPGHHNRCEVISPIPLFIHICILG